MAHELTIPLPAGSTWTVVLVDVGVAQAQCCVVGCGWESDDLPDEEAGERAGYTHHCRKHQD